MVCPAGFTCAGGSSLPSLCEEPGYWCPEGTSTSDENACDAGHYGSHLRAHEYTDASCEGPCACMPGKYCTAASIATEQFTIDSGNDGTCGVTTNNQAVCWGANGNGNLSPPSGTTFLSVSVGAYHSCGIRDTDFGVTCWGSNSFGETSLPSGVQYMQVSAGLYQTCAVAFDGSVHCSGGYQYGYCTSEVRCPLYVVWPCACAVCATCEC